MKIKVTKGLVRYYILLVGNNGEVLLVSQKYYSKSNAIRAAKKLSDTMGIPWKVIA